MARRHFVTPLVLALLVGSAVAQDVRLYRADEAVDPQDVARILDTSRHPAPAGKMRSLRLLDDAASDSSLPRRRPQRPSLPPRRMRRTQARPARQRRLRTRSTG
jgi:hypothetical protein